MEGESSTQAGVVAVVVLSVEPEGFTLNDGPSGTERVSMGPTRPHQSV